MADEQPRQMVLKDFIDQLTDAEIRRLIALLGLTQPQQPERQERTAA